MIILLVFVAFAILVSSSDNQRHHSHHHASLKSALRLGNSSLVPGITISGAVIHGDHSDGGKALPTNLTLLEGDIVSARIRHVDKLAAQLPFPLTRWPAVYSLHCPQYPDGHKTERGLCFAHYRIWKEFVYFDPLTLWKYELYKNSSLGNSTTNTGAFANETMILSEDGHYAISLTNGTHYKYNQPFKEEDIIVIFEDDADNTIVDLETTLAEELGAIHADLLFLGKLTMLSAYCFIVLSGWCDGRMARPVPLCAHAYALTRRGARKIIDKFEPCGKALDEQFVIIAKNNWITYRKAHPHSYKNLNSNYPVWGDKNFGIFHQKKSDLGSVNGHRRIRSRL